MSRALALLIVLAACSKSNDPQPIPKDYPFPGLLGSWNMNYWDATCGSQIDFSNANAKNAFDFTYLKATDGNYLTKNGTNEYQIKGDSIIIFYKNVNGVWIDFLRAQFELHNENTILYFNGKYTNNWIPKYAGCIIRYNFQK